MATKKIQRVIIDVALTAMIIVEMFIQFTGVFLHEIIGFVFLATVVTHLALSAKWIKNTAQSAKKGSMTPRRTALAVVGSLLGVTTLILGVSSVAISTILSDAGFTWTLGSYAMWATIHAVSSYALCAIATIHLGMHWAFLASAFRVPYDPSRRQAISTGVNAVAAVGAVALGVMAAREAVPYFTNAETSTQDSTGASNKQQFADVQVIPQSSNSSGSQRTGKGTRKMEGKSSSAQSPSPSEKQSENAAPSSNAKSGEDTAPNYDGSPSYDTGGSESTGSSSVSGICTLCRKQCPLSNPKCNKPYEAGLI